MVHLNGFITVKCYSDYSYIKEVPLKFWQEELNKPTPFPLAFHGFVVKDKKNFSFL